MKSIEGKAKLFNNLELVGDAFVSFDSFGEPGAYFFNFLKVTFSKDIDPQQLLEFGRQWCELLDELGDSGLGGECIFCNFALNDKMVTFRKHSISIIY